MKRIRIFLLIAVSFMTASREASAQRFAVGTNAVDWISLGTINAEASIAVSQHASVHVGAELNPWTFKAGDRETQYEARQNSWWAGTRWWPWHVYSGWWAGADARYSVYNIGGIWSREAEEGDAWGLGAYGGYSIMLNEFWNLDLGVGFWGGYKQYVRYACPLCGVKTEEGAKAFILPDARIAVQLIF